MILWNVKFLLKGKVPVVTWCERHGRPSRDERVSSQMPAPVQRREKGVKRGMEGGRNENEREGKWDGRKRVSKTQQKERLCGGADGLTHRSPQI
jgi:hypothetical protein